MKRGPIGRCVDVSQMILAEVDVVFLSWKVCE